MFKKVYTFYSAFCTQPAFYSQSAVCILHSVCILPLVRSLQSAVRSLRFTLTVLTSRNSQFFTIRTKNLELSPCIYYNLVKLSFLSEQSARIFLKIVTELA